MLDPEEVKRTINESIDEVVEQAKQNPNLVAHEIEIRMINTMFRSFTLLLEDARAENIQPKDVLHSLANCFSAMLFDFMLKALSDPARDAADVYLYFLERFHRNVQSDMDTLENSEGKTHDEIQAETAERAQGRAQGSGNSTFNDEVH